MGLDGRTKALIAVGASITANCQPCLQFHVSKARENGADEEELAVAIAVAKSVRKGASAKMDDFASGLAAAADRGAGRDCDCGADESGSSATKQGSCCG